MRYFFVDYENVNNNGLKGIESLKKNDKVFILYSENANTLKIDTVKKVRESKALIEFIDIQCLGTNALDFQLCVLLGEQIGKFRGKKLELYIVSKDHGYDTVQNGVAMLLYNKLKEKGISLKILRIENIDVILEKSKKSKKVKKDHNVDNNIDNIDNIIYDVLAVTRYAESCNDVKNLYLSKKNLTFRQFHNLCTHKFGPQDGRNIYILLKETLPLNKDVSN